MSVRLARSKSHSRRVASSGRAPAGPIALVATSAKFNDAGGTTIAMTLPAGSTGHYAVAVAWDDSGTTSPWNTLSGWTLTQQAQSPGGRTLAVYRRMLQAGDGNPTFTSSSAGSELQGALLTFKNVNTGTPEDVSPVGSTIESASPWTPTGLTPVTAGAMVISCCAAEFYTALSITALNSFAQAFSYNTASEGSLIAATRLVAAPGAVGMPSYQEPNLGRNSHICLALRPAS